MTDFGESLGADKSASTLLVLFIPSHDRDQGIIDQDYWVAEALSVLGTLFSGATAFPRGEGVWRDDERGGTLLFDRPVIIQCYTSEVLLEQKAGKLRRFLHRMGRETQQGAVGLVIDRDYLEISFPFDDETSTPPPKPKKRKPK
jgi:hypothetical protein